MFLKIEMDYLEHAMDIFVVVRILIQMIRQRQHHIQPKNKKNTWKTVNVWKVCERTFFGSSSSSVESYFSSNPTYERRIAKKKQDFRQDTVTYFFVFLPFRNNTIIIIKTIAIIFNTSTNKWEILWLNFHTKNFWKTGWSYFCENFLKTHFVKQKMKQVVRVVRVVSLLL